MNSSQSPDDAVKDGVNDVPIFQSLNPVARASARDRISDRVHKELAQAIRDLRLAPGATLSETELSRHLGVSRTPVREAISRLSDQGLVSVIPQVGTRVALIDLEEVEEACFVRCALEVAAFEKACEKPEKDLGLLRGILRRQEEAFVSQDVDAFFGSDDDLHGEIFSLAGYPRVWNLVRRSKLQLDRVRRLALPELMVTRTLVAEHTRIVDLLEASDVAQGIQLVEEHALHVLKFAPTIRSQWPSYFTS